MVDITDATPLEIEKFNYAEFEKTLLLHINERLFIKGYISESMFMTTKQILLHD